VLHAVCWKYRMQELRKKSPSAHHWTTPSSYIFATNTRIDNRQKKLVKQQHPLHMFLQYGELRTTNGWDWFGSLRHPSKFTSWLCYCSNIVTGGQPNFARCMAVSWAGILYIYFWCSCPVMEFCQVQNSLSVQVLPSPILTALLHGTPGEGVSRTFRHGTKNGITELSQRVPPIFGWAAIRLGIGPHSSLALFQNVAEVPAPKWSSFPKFQENPSTTFRGSLLVDGQKETVTNSKHLITMLLHTGNKTAWSTSGRLTWSERWLTLGFIPEQGPRRSRNFISSPAWYSSLSRLHTQNDHICTETKYFIFLIMSLIYTINLPDAITFCGTYDGG